MNNDKDQFSVSGDAGDISLIRVYAHTQKRPPGAQVLFFCEPYLGLIADKEHDLIEDMRYISLELVRGTGAEARERIKTTRRKLEKEAVK